MKKKKVRKIPVVMAPIVSVILKMFVTVFSSINRSYIFFSVITATVSSPRTPMVVRFEVLTALKAYSINASEL